MTGHPFFDVSKYPWARSDAQALLNVLKDCVSSDDEIIAIYERSGGDRASLAPNRTPELRWQEVLALLAVGQCLPELCQQLQGIRRLMKNAAFQKAVQDIIEARPSGQILPAQVSATPTPEPGLDISGAAIPHFAQPESLGEPVRPRGPGTTGQAPEGPRRKVTYFVSYSHDNEAKARDLVARLQSQMGPSRTFEHSIWGDWDILVGENWSAAIKGALESCNFGLLLVSTAFLNSPFINENELPVFVAGRRPLIPVALGAVDFKRHDLKGLQESQFFLWQRGPGGRRHSYAQLTRTNDKDEFAAELFCRIENRLAAHLAEENEQQGERKVIDIEYGTIKPIERGSEQAEIARRVTRTNRAWAVLNTRAARWQFRSDRTGQVSTDVIGSGELASVPDDIGASLAMSSDGSLLATMDGSTLHISTVSRSGIVRLWERFKFDQDAENPKAQVRAVARSGDLGVWCAVAYGDRTRFASLSRSTRPVWHEVRKLDAAEYAAFFGSGLLLVADDGSSGSQRRRRCWRVPLGPEANPVEWAPPGRDPGSITAIDAAKVGGRTYLGILARVADGNAGTDLISLPADGPCSVQRLGPGYEHVSVVRDPDGDPESVCVLVAREADDGAEGHRPFQKPVASV